ncbi:MAG: NAD(P)/FAD-dependent oxidoreductase [Promethearchaeota archaeon]
MVNPRVRKELPEVKPVEKKKNIAIVGGGLAGMEAAIILTERGHNVKIFEKDRLGGQFKYAPLTPEKKSLHKLIPAFTHRIEELKIPVEYKEATEEDLVGKFDEVILATGGEPRIIPFPGLEKYYWAEILLPENMPTGKHVAIIGGGLIGVDVALALIAHNNRVSIIEILPEIGGNMEAIAKKLSLHTLQQKQAVLSPNTKVVKIEGNKIYAEENGMEVVFDNVDIIVVATGMRPYRPLEEKLKGKIPYYLIGDAKAIGDAQTAIRDAYDLAITL